MIFVQCYFFQCCDFICKYIYNTYILYLYNSCTYVISTTSGIYDGNSFLACLAKRLSVTRRLSSVNFSHVFKTYGKFFGSYDNWVEKVQIYTNEVGPLGDGSSRGS